MQAILDKQIKEGQVNLPRKEGDVELTKITWFTKPTIIHQVITELTKRPNPAVMWKFRLLFKRLMKGIKEYPITYPDLPPNGQANKLCILRKDELEQLKKCTGKSIEILEFMELECRPSGELPKIPLESDE